MTTEVTTNPVATLMRNAYNLGVEHHSTCQMPKPREDFFKNYSIDDELLVGLDELYSVYRKGYRAGAPVKLNNYGPDDLSKMLYSSKLDYVKADPRFLYVSSNGFCYKDKLFRNLDEAYLYTQRFLEKGIEG